MRRITTLAMTAVAVVALNLAHAVAADSPSGNPGNAQVTQRITGQFSGFAGSDENAGSLVNGLRTGSAITLTPTNSGLPGTQAVTFTPLTRPMGYGNVTISLALARQQLAGLGITNPTPEQIAAALNGGSVTTPTGTTNLTGVLTLRSQGMGWGQIAQAQGVTLGSVMHGVNAPPQSATASDAAGTNGIVTAGGAVAHGNAGITHGGGATASNGKFDSGTGNGAPHSGIVTAAGAVPSYGAAISGSRAATSGIVHANGGGGGGGMSASSRGH